MSTTVTFNGTSYTVPATGDENWSDNLSAYLIAIASGSLQKTGGTFTLTAEIDYGATYGIKSAYYKSRGTNPSSTGVLRLANAESVSWRNAANNADLALKVNASDLLEYNGSAIVSLGSLTDLITNTMVNSSAAIAYSKLNLATSIVNADINASAAIAYSKLNLTNSIVNADLTGGIAADKIGGGFVDNFEFSYLSGVTSAIQTQLDAKVPKTLTTTTGDMIYASSANTPARLPVGSSGQVIKSVGGIPTWATFSGGINYLSSNPDAEADTSGWATYADAAASSPVDGTGGSPSSTFTRSTSSPLRGTASFLWTKSAANRQGEGFSYGFTIDASDKAKVLQISFDYLVSSGTYADSDMTIWIYDVTNAALIQPAGYTIQNAAVSMKQLATFQSASNSTSYRLIVHTASTSASAYTLQFDNFSVGPQVVTNGAAVSDWVSWTPTGSWSTNTTYTGYWRRNGGDVEVQFKVATSGAPTSANLTVNLPSGLVMDTSKIVETAENSLGWLRGRDEGTGSWSGWLKYNNTTSVTCNYITVSSANDNIALGVVTQAAPMTFANTDYLVGYFKAPIVGWSSNVQLSSDTDTRVVAMRAYRASSNQAIAVSTATTVIFNATSFDTHGGMNTTTGVYTVPIAGKYKVTANLYITSAAAEVFNYYILKNGAATSLKFFTATADSMNTVTDIMDCVAGDTISIQVDSTADTSYSVVYDTSVTYFNVERLSGPSVIAASESVGIFYSGAPATGTIAGSFNVTTYGTKVKDTHSAYSSGTWTCPVSGCYSISASVDVNGTYVASNRTLIEIWINGAAVARGGGFAGSSSTSNIIAPVNIQSYPILAGQTVQVKSFSEATTPAFRAEATNNYLSIAKVGNY